VIISLGNKAAKDIWERNESKALPRDLWLRAKALMTIMYNTDTLDDLKIQGQPPNIRLHKLKGDLKDYWSVTIALPWCLIFQFKNGNFSDVKIVDYHKG
jgi:proteic killer suppression protein